jgi:predicted nucleotidyltransferase component of viral defense system
VTSLSPDRIKQLAIIAMFSDDDLMEKLVLKGGNALDIIYKIASRASLDIDFSIQHDFSEDELEDLESRIKTALENTFGEEGYSVFDVKL